VYARQWREGRLLWVSEWQCQCLDNIKDILAHCRGSETLHKYLITIPHRARAEQEHSPKRLRLITFSVSALAAAAASEYEQSCWEETRTLRCPFINLSVLVSFKQFCVSPLKHSSSSSSSSSSYCRHRRHRARLRECVCDNERRWPSDWGGIISITAFSSPLNWHSSSKEASNPCLGVAASSLPQNGVWAHHGSTVCAPRGSQRRVYQQDGSARRRPWDLGRPGGLEARKGEASAHMKRVQSELDLFPLSCTCPTRANPA
jgi:hypothetical protein